MVAVDVEDNTRARDVVDTGVVAAAVLAVEASSVDVVADAVVNSGAAVVASAVLLAASHLRRGFWIFLFSVTLGFKRHTHLPPL